MNTDRTLAMVRGLVTPLDDTLSVYLAAPPPSEVRPVTDTDRRWRALEDRMRARGVDEPTLHAIWTPARAAAAVRCGVAVFARHGQVVYTQRLPGWTGQDLATYGAPAHVVPLLEWLRTLVPYVVVDGAEITAFQDIGHPLASVRVIAQPNHPAVADHCARLANAIGAHLIVAVGVDVDLPDPDGLVVHQVPGGSHERRQACVDTAVRRYAADRQRALVNRFDNLRGPAGIAVEGLSETLAALAQDRVTTLIVASGLHEHPSAWFADPPTAVALNPAEVFEHHRAVRRGPLTDVAVRAALLAGADVRVLSPDTAGGPTEGLGGLCRLTQPPDACGTVIPMARRRRTSRSRLRGLCEPPRRR
jgi:hypothetical protein